MTKYKFTAQVEMIVDIEDNEEILQNHQENFQDSPIGQFMGNTMKTKKIEDK